MLAAGGDAIGVDTVYHPGHDAIDIRDTDKLARYIEGCSLIVHCAGLHAPHVGHQPQDAFWSINVDGTQSVVKAAKMVGVATLVLTSTTALYGGGAQAGQPARWIDENSPPRVRTIYHETKLAAEDIVSDVASSDLKVAIVRLGRCFPEPLNTMILHRLSRGISEADAARAHLWAARTASPQPEPINAVAKSPFRKSDCAALGGHAAEVIRQRCPDVATFFDRKGWDLPKQIDRIYSSQRALDRWGWEPMESTQEMLGT